jgi:acyl-CoA synthetase (AMP-forming)/AMP-acid ligase II
VNLCDPIDDAVAAVPQRTALIIGDRAITYREVGGAVAHAASTFARRGIGAGDRVALVDVASLGSVATVLGCARIGAAAAPMSARSTASEIATLADAAGCGSVGVASAEIAPTVRSALGADPLDEATLLSGSARDTAERAATSEDDVAVVLFTSGTTGTPKPIPLTHGVLARRVKGFAVAPDPKAAPAVSLICVPFHHVAGLVGVLVGLAGGNTAVFQSHFDAGEWLTLIERHGVQRAFLVPAMLHRILEHASFEEADLSSLQMITYGAAPAAPELVERAVAAMPRVAFINVFGQTETLGAVTALGPDDHRAGRAGSVGRAMPGVEIRIVDPATGDDVPEGEVGEFWVRAEHTVTAGWVRTGDLVRRDSDGYLYATGRMSDVINRGGEKIDPAEVETVLRAHASVADAAVFGIPDAELGERVGAGVVPRGDLAEASELQSWCRERLASFKVPERIVFLNELPLTELGKVSRRSLRSLVE